MLKIKSILGEPNHTLDILLEHASWSLYNTVCRHPWMFHVCCYWKCET